MKKTAIKFCGGCNPTFDRVDYWNRIAAAASRKMVWVGQDEPDIDALLLICGCRTACAEKSFHPARYNRFIVVRDEEQSPERIAQRLLGECKEPI